MSEWISVLDKEPEMFMMVLVTDGNFVDIAGMQTDGEFSDTCFLDGEVTHWMPLPELPKED